jgi:hypothetical protein
MNIPMMPPVYFGEGQASKTGFNMKKVNPEIINLRITYHKFTF